MDNWSGSASDGHDSASMIAVDKEKPMAKSPTEEQTMPIVENIQPKSPATACRYYSDVGSDSDDNGRPQAKGGDPKKAGMPRPVYGDAARDPRYDPLARTPPPPPPGQMPDPPPSALPNYLQRGGQAGGQRSTFGPPRSQTPVPAPTPRQVQVPHRAATPAPGQHYAAAPNPGRMAGPPGHQPGASFHPGSRAHAPPGPSSGIPPPAQGPPPPQPPARKSMWPRK